MMLWSWSQRGDCHYLLYKIQYSLRNEGYYAFSRTHLVLKAGYVPLPRKFDFFSLFSEVLVFKISVLSFSLNFFPVSSFNFHIWVWLYQKKKKICASLIAQLVKNLPAVQETHIWFLGWEDLLEKEMATHSSILAWRIPWTEEPGGLQSMGLQE